MRGWLPVTTDEDWRAPGTPAPPSPVLTDAIGRVSSGLDALLAVAPASLSDEDVARLLDFATSCVDRAAGAVTAAVGEADHRRLGDAIGARHTGQWWARRSLLTRPEAHRLTKLGRRLSRELYAPVQAALAAGEVHADQAAVIVNAVEAIPTSSEDLPSYADPPPVLKARAVAHLLVLAKDHDATALQRLGRRILDTVAPAVGEAAEAKALAEEEAAAARRVSLTLRDQGNGTSTGRFTLPTPAAEMLRKQLLAIAAPKHQAATGNPDPDPDPDPEPGPAPDADGRPLPARLGWAFIEWIERYPADHLPAAGGVSATVVVTMGLDTLTGGLAAASLDTGARISAGQARRLACEAGIIPAVLGGTSEVLDLGRTRRFHTRAQRIAIAQRDRGCTAQGCDLPPAACHVHHDQPWSRGGPTDTHTGRLLCHRHHRVIHDDRYQTTRHPNGTVSFHRRT
jgi:hypothetical protein